MDAIWVILSPLFVFRAFLFRTGLLRSALIFPIGWVSQVAAELVLCWAWVGAGSLVDGFARSPVPLYR